MGTRVCTLVSKLCLHMACSFFRLTPLEAVQGVTHHAARALGLTDRGTLAVGHTVTHRDRDTEADRQRADRHDPRAANPWVTGALSETESGR